MATKQRSRSRRSGSNRDRTPRYVAPVLDPTWQSPYVPSSAERHAHHRAVRSFALRRKLPQSIIVGVVALAAVAMVTVSIWLPVVGVAVALLYAWDVRQSLTRVERSGRTLGASLRASFAPGGSDRDRERLSTIVDRLAATFGVTSVSSFVVEDAGYNAALVPDGGGFAMLVTSAVARDFELIELEGVVAHCLARQRLGILERQAVASALSAGDEARRTLAGTGLAYRADEVAAATIRYPLGLAAALHKCAEHAPPTGSYFATPAYAGVRWVWFDLGSDRTASDLSDLDDATLRARALEEW